MTRLGGAVLSLIIVSAAPAFAISDPVRVETGQLEGVAGTGAPSVRVYKGIPFAAPPLGNNRWRAPQPALKWEGVRKADAFGAPCIAGPAPRATQKHPRFPKQERVRSPVSLPGGRACAIRGST